jgi:hypothetical protein
LPAKLSMLDFVSAFGRGGFFLFFVFFFFPHPLSLSKKSSARRYSKMRRVR